MLEGRCFCGAVRFMTPEPLYPPTLCHCQSCRRASGAHAVGWYTVRISELRYTQGEPVTRESSAGVFRAYCRDCFSPLTYRAEARPQEIDITISSLDQPERVAPVDHIYMADAVAWDQPCDGRPQFLLTRSGHPSGA